MQRARFDPRSWPAHDGGTLCLIARPIAGAALDLAMAERRDIRRRIDRARTLKLPAVLSLLAHAAALLTAILFLPSRTEPPAMPPESSIALVFAPAPAALPSAADVAPAPVEEPHETATTEATPPPVQPEPTATEPPPPTPLPTTAEPEQEAQPAKRQPDAAQPSRAVRTAVSRGWFCRPCSDRRDRSSATGRRHGDQSSADLP